MTNCGIIVTIHGTISVESTKRKTTFFHQTRRRANAKPASAADAVLNAVNELAITSELRNALPEPTRVTWPRPRITGPANTAAPANRIRARQILTRPPRVGSEPRNRARADSRRCRD